MESWTIRLALVLALAQPALAGAQSPLYVGISGQESFAGLPLGNLTIGVNFSGWTTADGSAWSPITQHTGGNWFAVLAYRGQPRTPGGGTELLTGYWSVTYADATHGGEFTAGTVRWPEGTESGWTCFAADGSYPVAAFAAKVTLADSADVGTFTGCLDDIHWSADEPLRDIPRVWGEIRFPGAVAQPAR